MTQNKICSTCNWWCRVHKSKRFGLCVLHTGSKDHKPMLKFGGSLKPVASFGCVCWELSDRQSVQSQSEGE
jgi:uncharacterized Fe-S radical SAM superfamily protein PflX